MKLLHKIGIVVHTQTDCLWVTASQKTQGLTTSVGSRGIIWPPEDHAIQDPVYNPIPALSNKPNIYFPT